jgi:hypothetical protein
MLPVLLELRFHIPLVTLTAGHSSARRPAPLLRVWRDC